MKKSGARVRRAICLGLLAMISTLSAASTPERSTIDEKYKWDLSKMYADSAAWEKHHQDLEKQVTEFAALKGSVHKSAKALAGALKLRDSININLEKLYAFAAMKRDEDMREPSARPFTKGHKHWR